MTIKITLITPPDIYENDNRGILLLNLPETAQTEATAWFANFQSDEDINIYFYNGETEVPWILHAMAVSQYKYIDIDETSGVSSWLAGYILGKPNTYYTAKDLNVASIYSHINSNKVADVVEFLERTLGVDNKQ
jgi:hypothetical protein